MSRMERAAKWTSISTLISMIVAFAQLAILSRLLDSAIFGQFAILNLLIELASAFALGGIANYLIFKKDIDAKGMSTVYWISCIVGGGLSGLLYLVAPVLLGIFGQAEIQSYLQILCILLFINALSAQYQALAIKHFKQPTLAKIEIVSTLLGFCVAMLFVKSGLFCLVMAAIATSLSKLALSILCFGKFARPSMTFCLDEAKQVYAYGIYNIGSQFLTIIRRQLDTLILSLLLPIHTLGVYHVIKQLAARPGQALQPIAVRLLMPLFSEHQQHKPTLKQTYLDGLSVLAFVLALIYTPMILLSLPITELVFGENYTEHHLILALLSVFWFVRIAGPTVMGGLVQSTGHTKLTFYWNLYTLPVSILVMTLAAWQGIYSLCIALTIFQLLLFVLSQKLLVSQIITINLMEVIGPVFKPALIFLGLLMLLKTLTMTLQQYLPLLLLLTLIGFAQLSIAWLMCKHLDDLKLPINRLRRA